MPKSLSQEYSHKLDIFFTVSLSAEDIAMIESNCKRLGFEPKPSVVGRALLRFGLDSVGQGLIDIHSIYSTYNVAAVSVANSKPDNPISAILNPIKSKNDLETLQEFCAVNRLSLSEGITRWLSVMAGVCRLAQYDLSWLTGEVEAMKERA